MPEHSGAATRPATGLGHVWWEALKRLYALALMVLVAWLSWRAFAYLVIALLLPARPPPQITEIPKRLDAATLSRPQPLAGQRAAENPRAPLAHYHRLGSWFRVADPANDCTRSGCHAPLPHHRDKASRAFLNMHATSLHCGVCHLDTAQQPLPLVWYDLETGAATPPPALLQAFAWLNSQSQNSLPAADQNQIVGLIRAAAEQSGGDPGLSVLAEHLAAVRVDSEEFTRLLDVARDTVAAHFRGEYGAKLALREGDGRPWLGHRQSEAAVQEYLARGASLPEPERLELLARVHPQRRNPTLNCTQCHQAEKPLVDLASVGYPPARILSLLQPMLLHAIENAMQGEPWYAPGFITPGTGPREEP